MTRIVATTREGAEQAIDMAEGSLMEAIRVAAMDELQALCCGGGGCAPSHVWIDAA